MDQLVKFKDLVPEETIKFKLISSQFKQTKPLLTGLVKLIIMLAIIKTDLLFNEHQTNTIWMVMETAKTMNKDSWLSNRRFYTTSRCNKMKMNQTKCSRSTMIQETLKLPKANANSFRHSKICCRILHKELKTLRKWVTYSK